MSDYLERNLPAALDELAQRAPIGPLDPALVRRRAVRQRRRMVAGPVMVVLMIVGIVTGVPLSRPNSTLVADPAATSTCVPLQTGEPPVWARAGFTGNGYPPFATSDSGDVVAIVFGNPLTASPATDHNKILWVVRGGATGEMTMTARLEGSSGRVVTRKVPAGPSTVDMPAAGCWHLDLQIGDRHDSIDLYWNRH